MNAGGWVGGGKLQRVGKERGSVISSRKEKYTGRAINIASFPSQQFLPLICFVRQVFNTD